MADEEEVEFGGSYVTRGRGQALERKILALEARLNERIETLERRLSHAETLPLDMLRAIVTSGLALLRERVETAPEQAQEQKRSA